MKVLALTPSPERWPGPRFRVHQFIKPLAAHGIDVTFKPFFTEAEYAIGHASGQWVSKGKGMVAGSLRRMGDVISASQYDAVWVYLWNFPYFNPMGDARLMGHNVVYELDDPYYDQKESKMYKLRGERWLTQLLTQSKRVVVSSERMKHDVHAWNTNVEVIPTAVDMNQYKPHSKARDPKAPLVIGWVGTKTTEPFVHKLKPIFQSLAKKYSFEVRVVGGTGTLRWPGVNLKQIEWQQQQEVAYFQDLDIGLYPLDSNHFFSQTKPGFKLWLYFACGVPVVADNVGATAQSVPRLDVPPALLANHLEDWEQHLEQLIVSTPQRKMMSTTARVISLDAPYTLERCTEHWVNLFHSIC